MCKSLLFRVMGKNEEEIKEINERNSGRSSRAQNPYVWGTSPQSYPLGYSECLHAVGKSLILQ